SLGGGERSEDRASWSGHRAGAHGAGAVAIAAIGGTNPRWQRAVLVAARAIRLRAHGLEYVPRTRRSDLVQHLLAFVVRRRLIVGPANEEHGVPEMERVLIDGGFSISGRAEVPH